MGAFTKVWQTKWRDHERSGQQQSRLHWLMIALLILGIGFRFGAIDRKVYWHDEVYTSMRAAGFTRQEIDAELFQNHFVSVPTLQKFQQIKPGSTYGDTLHSLITEDPQHPPLYFWIARFWMQQFGSSILASRLLPVLISLLSLPLIYGLAMELFANRLTALLAMGLLALSPFDILFAQTARQYSLLSVMVLASSWLLLRAMRCSGWRFWTGYGLSVAAGFYTHPFFALTLLVHGAYVLAIGLLQPEQLQSKQPAKSPIELRPSPQSADQAADSFCQSAEQPHQLNRLNRQIWRFGFAVVGSLILYSPWIWVMVRQYQRAAATTDWTNTIVSFSYLLKLWTLSFSSLFIDLDFGLSNPLTFALRIPFVLLILAALYQIYRHPVLQVRLFVLLTALLPFLLLVIPDLVMGGKRSTVSRYLISCYPGIQLAVASLLSRKLMQGKVLWRGVLGFTIVGSLISCSVSALSDSWWNKDLSYHNAEVVQLVNAATEQRENSPAPVLVSDMGDDSTNMGDLISISYQLKPEVNLFLVSQPPRFMTLGDPTGAFIFRASQSLQTAIAEQGWQTKPISHPARLWQIEAKRSSN